MKKLLALGLIAISYTVASCSNAEETSTASPVSSAIAPSSESTTTPSFSAGPTNPVFTCLNEGNQEVVFTSLADIWAYSEPFSYADCSVSMNGDELNVRETESIQILNAALEGEARVRAVESMYSTCANRTTDYDSEEFIADPVTGNAPSLTVAKSHLALCPEHPMAETIQAKIDAAELTAELARVEAAKPEPVRLEGGRYLVGIDTPAGNYATDSDRLVDCYWEISDQSGNIIDNNFISISRGISLTLSEGTGFTTRNCGTWTLQK